MMQYNAHKYMRHWIMEIADPNIGMRPGSVHYITPKMFSAVNISSPIDVTDPQSVYEGLSEYFSVRKTALILFHRDSEMVCAGQVLVDPLPTSINWNTTDVVSYSGHSTVAELEKELANTKAAIIVSQPDAHMDIQRDYYGRISGVGRNIWRSIAPDSSSMRAFQTISSFLRRSGITISHEYVMTIMSCFEVFPDSGLMYVEPSVNKYIPDIEDLVRGGLRMKETRNAISSQRFRK